MGTFSSITKTKTVKTLMGAAIGVGFGVFSLLLVVSLGTMPKTTALGWVGVFLLFSLPWALVWAAVGFFSGRRRTSREAAGSGEGDQP